MNIQLNRVCATALAVVVGVSASADVVVVVSAKSAASSLSKDQVSDIYNLKMKELPDGSAIAPMMLAPGNARNDFLSNVLNRTDAQMKAYWAKLTFTGKGAPPKEAESATDLKKMLSSNPNLIGYMDKADVDGTVKVVFKP